MGGRLANKEAIAQMMAAASGQESGNIHSEYLNPSMSKNTNTFEN